MSIDSAFTTAMIFGRMSTKAIMSIGVITEEVISPSSCPQSCIAVEVLRAVAIVLSTLSVITKIDMIFSFIGNNSNALSEFFTPLNFANLILFKVDAVIAVSIPDSRADIASNIAIARKLNIIT